MIEHRQKTDRNFMKSCQAQRGIKQQKNYDTYKIIQTRSVYALEERNN